MLSPGELLQGRYCIVRPIGVGGMGAVYEAENTLIRRRVAIKVMHGGALRNSEMSARFEREAQIVNLINSEHVVEVLDLGHLPDKDPFIVMEYLEGRTLAERIGKAPVPARDLVPLLCQVLDGLGRAHTAGVIHRDIKPDNIFLIAEKGNQKDFVKILDFGISKLGDTGDEPGLTQTGATIGTPGYMAPEQIGGGDSVKPPADLYAVGVILYRGLTGQPPFRSDRLNELLMQIAQGGAKPACEVDPSVDPVLSQIIERAMRVTCTDRYQTADEMRAALLGWLSDSPDATRSSAASSNGASREQLNTLSGLQPGGDDSYASFSGSHTLPPSERTESLGRASWMRQKAPQLLVLAAIAGVSIIGANWNSNEEGPALFDTVPKPPKDTATRSLQRSELPTPKQVVEQQASAEQLTPSVGAPIEPPRPMPVVSTPQTQALMAPDVPPSPKKAEEKSSLRPLAKPPIKKFKKVTKRPPGARGKTRRPATPKAASTAPRSRVRPQPRKTTRPIPAKAQAPTAPSKTPKRVDWGY